MLLTCPWSDAGMKMDVNVASADSQSLPEDQYDLSTRAPSNGSCVQSARNGSAIVNG